jgi:protein-tyrosine-phosphatase
MKILFICKHNKFRSKVAEAIFNKLNKNKKVRAESAGIIQGSSISKMLKNYYKEFGIKIKSKPRSVTSKIVKESDLIVIVADNVPKSIFKNKKVIVWRISDAEIREKKKIIKLISKIKKRVEKLIKELN